MKTKKVLVVDDDVQYVDSVKTLLESQGFQVDVAYDTAKGFEKAKANVPDLILLDVMFAGRQGQDGFETARQLHNDEILKDVPVLIISGVQKVHDFDWKYEPDETWMPVKGFLEKPIKPSKLLSEIKKVLS